MAKNDPAGLIPWAIGKLLPGVNRFKGDALHQYLREARVDGTPLYEHGFWNLLARALSPDAYAVARTLIGYDCLGSNANAVDLISEIYDFAPDVKYYLLKQGYETVPWTLQQKFEEAGGELVHGAWVAGFDRTTLADGTTGVEVHFRGDRPSGDGAGRRPGDAAPLDRAAAAEGPGARSRARPARAASAERGPAHPAVQAVPGL